jgi:hypothetical protein
VYCKLTDFTAGNGLALFVNDLSLPKVTRLTDSTDLVLVLNTEVNTAGTDGLGKTVVGVISVMGEYVLPTTDKAGRNGLSTDVHKSPLRETVFRKIDSAVVDSVKNILCPRNEKPNDGTLFFGNGSEDPLGLNSAEKNSTASRKERTEPVHLSTRVIKGRNTEEHVILCLSVVILLCSA